MVLVRQVILEESLEEWVAFWFQRMGPTYNVHFGMQVPEDWMQVLLQHSSHPVHELEVLPVLISFHVWSHFLRGSQVLHYTDNDSCRFALMKGVGETFVARRLVASIMDRVSMPFKPSLGTAVYRATAILQMILAVDLSMPWLREVASVAS